MKNMLEELLNNGLKAEYYSGAAAVCGDRKGITAIACAGKTMEGGEPINTKTQFDMASLTKILVPTMIALRAIEKGDITLYDPLSMYIEHVPEDKREINLFQLMTHTAGFSPSFRLDHLTDEPKEVLRTILEQPLEYERGKEPHYSCMGYIILGKVLEGIYKAGLDELARTQVFEPLKMTMTGYCPSGNNIAATEIDPVTKRAWHGIVHDENARFMGGISGNAGVFSTIEDMACFAQMLANGGKGYLSQATLNKAVSCLAESEEMRRGLGFQLAGTPYNFMGELAGKRCYGHTGFTGTSMMVDPCTGVYIVLLTNRVYPTRENTDFLRFRRIFHNQVNAEFAR